MHKTITNVLVLSAMVLASHSVQADDTEIFFAEATADNASNRPVANVLFLLDTSGSMRWCESATSGSYNSGNPYWCSDPDNRRINMLVDAVNDVLDNVQDGVRIGLGRFNDNRDGNDGGRVLVPVVEVNEDTKSVFRETLNSLNAAGETSSGGSNGEPKGGTPTATAYSEMARYMMGMTPRYGSGYPNTEVCTTYEDEEYNCRQEVVGYGEWQESATACNPADASCIRELGEPVETATPCDVSLDTCDADYGSWTDSPDACDPSLDTCRVSDYGSWQTVASCDTSLDTCRQVWTNWETTISSGANSGNCPTIYTSDVEQRRVTSGFWIWTTTRCERRERIYQEREAEYQVRDVTYYERPVTYYTRDPVYDEVCDVNRVCTDTKKIVGDDGKYISPMDMNNECESNHVVIFTDGSPSSEDTRNWGFVDCSNTGSYTCQRRISGYLNQRSMFDGSVITNAKGRPVKTYNVGLYMGSNESNMESVSTDGDEGTHTADDADSLLDAFSSLLKLIAEESRSFASPGVAVNQMNRLQHLDQLYYAVFKPRKSSYWDGNLKRYRIGGGEIRAQNGPAVDPDTGYFSVDAESYWTEGDDLPDGPDVAKGGARQQVELEGTRKLMYTDASENMQTLAWDTQNNPTFYGLPFDASQDEVDQVKETLKSMWGDPLHSEPTLVNYGGTAENNYIFVSNNGGMLHAISSQTGEEKFAFMPHQLISRADEFTVNRPGLGAGNARQLYGLDSSWTAWRRSGETAISAPDAVYLYGGMRRGGYSYFALDVSNLNSPDLMWQIDRGDTGFGRLGQTWSQPTLLAVKVNGVPTPALVFGGGYSPNDHDEKQGETRGAGDQMGNAIYVINALTGNLIWSASASGADSATHTNVAAMRWSIPSTVAAVDLNFDGFDDYLYFGDLRGQVFRIDLDNDDVVDSEVHQIADFSGASSAQNRRFFYAPAIGYHEDEASGQEALYITIGSGYRAHPLDETVDDYFFVIKDDTALNGQNPAEVLDVADLVQIANGATATFGDKGWALPFTGDGEKATASPLVFGGRVFFTSYEPGVDASGIEACEVKVGTSYLYVRDLVTGAPLTVNGGTTTEPKIPLEQDVPPPTPTPISDGENTMIVVGTEIVGEDEIGGTNVRRGSWYKLAPTEPDKVPLP